MLQRFSHKGLTLSFHDNGLGGTPLVFQHGLTGDHGQILSSYPNARRRVVTLECRGHGASETGPDGELSLHTFTDDLRALLAFLGIKKAAFAGISMGAAVAAQYVCRYGDAVEKAVLIRPSWHRRACPVNMQCFLTVAEYCRAFGPERGAERFRESGVYRSVLEESPDNAASLLGIFSKGTPERTAELLRRIVLCDPGFDAEAFRRHAPPTLVLGCGRDAVHPEALAREIARELPGARYAELYPKSLDRERHVRELVEAIDGFLDR